MYYAVISLERKLNTMHKNISYNQFVIEFIIIIEMGKSNSQCLSIYVDMTSLSQITRTNLFIKHNQVQMP
jgi:hypothetical protein